MKFAAAISANRASTSSAGTCGSTQKLMTKRSCTHFAEQAQGSSSSTAGSSKPAIVRGAKSAIKLQDELTHHTSALRRGRPLYASGGRSGGAIIQRCVRADGVHQKTVRVHP